MEHWMWVQFLSDHIHTLIEQLSSSSWVFNLLVAFGSGIVLHLIRLVWAEITALFHAFVYVTFKIQGGLASAIQFLEHELQELCDLQNRAYKRYLELRPEQRWNVFHPSVRHLRKMEKKVHRADRKYHLAKLLKRLRPDDPPR